MKKFDVVILGGGCSGLSLAYALHHHKKLLNKRLLIVDPRLNYSRDKTWSFWKVAPHLFEDCVMKSWSRFKVNDRSKHITADCRSTPYQTIDSGAFYQKIRSRLLSNPAVTFSDDFNQSDTQDALIFSSIPPSQTKNNGLWQHFKGIEIETATDCFNDQEFTLMDFNCDQRGHLHFFYILPFSSRRALIESTWFSRRDTHLEDYDFQLRTYIRDTLKIGDYHIKFEETGAIPLFHINQNSSSPYIPIGTAGGMTRISSGYTFLNIQHHSNYLARHIDNIQNLPRHKIPAKYHWMDGLFIKVLDQHPHMMPMIFRHLFEKASDETVRFLANKSGLKDDLRVILTMPKRLFIHTLFSNWSRS